MIWILLPFIGLLKWAYVVSPAYVTLVWSMASQEGEAGEFGSRGSSPAGSPRTGAGSVHSSSAGAQSSALAPLASTVRSRTVAPRSFNRSGSVSDSSTLVAELYNTIPCPKCQLRKPADGAICKGHSVWCLDCNLAYNNVQTRWQKSARLKAWWNSLSGEAQVAWFRKWGTMSSRQRFDTIILLRKL